MPYYSNLRRQEFITFGTAWLRRRLDQFYMILYTFILLYKIGQDFLDTQYPDVMDPAFLRISVKRTLYHRRWSLDFKLYDIEFALQIAVLLLSSRENVVRRSGSSHECLSCRYTFYTGCPKKSLFQSYLSFKGVYYVNQTGLLEQTVSFRSSHLL